MTDIGTYIDALHAAERSGLRSVTSLAGDGPVALLEDAMRKRLRVRHTLAVSSATAGLYAALRALDIRAGDHVITPALDWGATTAAITACGATPIYVDVDADRATLDPDAVAARLTADTVAIVVTHLFGIPADLTRLARLADRHGLALVEDCAQALGASHAGRPVGTHGDVGVYSFGPGKIIDAGEGGLVVCRDRQVYERAVAITQHPLRQTLEGLIPQDCAVHARIHPVAALTAHHQLAALDERLARRHASHDELLDIVARNRDQQLEPLRPAAGDRACWHRHPFRLHHTPSEAVSPGEGAFHLHPLDPRVLRAPQPTARSLMQQLGLAQHRSAPRSVRQNIMASNPSRRTSMARGKACPYCGFPMYAASETDLPATVEVTYECPTRECKHREKVCEDKR